MGNFFNVDNVFFSTLSKACDLLFLSIVWIFLCIPIVTLGPATTAMYYATVKVVRKERGYLFREFFKSFKLNFKRGAIVGVIMVIIFFVLSFDISWAWYVNDSNMRPILIGVFAALIFLALSFTLYIFPILSRFEMTVKQLFKAAAFMSMRHLPYTILMVVVTIASVFGILYTNLLLLFIVPSLSMFINSFMIERVFKKYMPKSEGPGEETGKDEWYAE